jgi:positive regulator of sigma E activity
MVNIGAKSVLGYLLQLIAGVAVVVGILMLFSSVVRGDLFGIVLALVLSVGGVLVLKRPSRARRAR